ncbi:MAG TPA: MerR family transcriptional regulator [Roseiflexaceae bacterium]|nr:MerR family transcriptional regulator [Roseiflexaceae bacterium]
MYKISDFARLSRVSAKMLRHYDEIGLLRPTFVDPSSEYRFYTPEQLPRLNRIVVLKDLGFSLQQIATLLADDLSGEQIKGMLKLRRAEVEQRIEAEQQRLAQLDERLAQLERAGREPRYDVVLRPVAALPAATVQATATSEAAVGTLLDELEWYVGRRRARAAQPPAVVYHVCEPGLIQIEVAVPISGALPSKGRVRAAELPAVQMMACLVHVGDDDTLDAACSALLRWVETHGYRTAGPIRELYLRYAPAAPPHLPLDFVAEQPDSAVTEYQVPVVAA